MSSVAMQTPPPHCAPKKQTNKRVSDNTSAHYCTTPSIWLRLSWEYICVKEERAVNLPPACERNQRKSQCRACQKRHAATLWRWCDAVGQSGLRHWTVALKGGDSTVISAAAKVSQWGKKKSNTLICSHSEMSALKHKTAAPLTTPKSSVHTFSVYAVKRVGNWWRLRDKYHK